VSFCLEIERRWNIFVEEHKLEVKDIKIKSTKSEKRFLNGEYIIIEGECKVNPGDYGSFDEEPFIMSFIYEGKPNESSSKLLEYLGVMGWHEYIKINHKEPDTLISFINKNII